MAFEVPENKKITEYEEDVLKYWKDNKIFEKSIESKSKDNQYVFYDGPPFISGLPHYGHLLGSIAKDLIPRYWTMKGKRVERVWGWDAHGLTVENKVQKELGIKNRKDIESYGLEKFINACDEYTSKIVGDWEWYIDKIGRWVDMENAYKTTDQSYMESVIWAFKQLYDKGLIYEGVRTSLYCPTCGTPVSDFEIAMDNSYKDVEDPAVTLKFKVKEGAYEGSFILAWTTTPWTLPSNRALVVDEKSTYVLVEFENETFIVAKDRLDFVFDKAKVLKEIKGSEVVGLKYVPLYEIYKATEKDYQVYSFEGMVHMEEGTGIVHSAPGFGDIDTEMGQHYDLSMTFAMDDTGSFKPGDNENPFEGMYFKKANKFILSDLEERSLLFKNETIEHRYPFHDRCDTLLMHRAQSSWFVDVASIKDGMLKNNENIHWVPNHIKDKQFPQIIENAPDWCISRNRFWATPMPVWQSEDGDRIVIGSIEELEDLSGQKVKNLHRPFIDEITIEKDGKNYKRVPDVLDSWFEAGSMPYAQFHYPFENKEKFEKNYPGDYIVEYIAQVRAWFNVMHRLSTALFGSNSFKNVIVTGVMAGNDGRKMSKTFGNYTDPKDVLENIGGDALRLFLMNSPLMVASNANFDDVELKTKSRNVLNPLWNSTKFFLIYAKQHKWEPKNVEIPESQNVLDAWIVTRLHETIQNFVVNIEDYVVPSAVKGIEEFVDDLSRWYVRRSRDRISNGDEEALGTLYYVLLTLSKAAAPVIHLEEYPEYDEKLITENKNLLDQMKSDRLVVSQALSERVSSEIPVRQPLEKFTVNRKVYFEDIVKEEVNVKEIVIEENEDLIKVTLDTEITKELALEKFARDTIRKIQSLRKTEGLSVEDVIDAEIEASDDTEELLKTFGPMIKEAVGAENITEGTEYAIYKKS